MGFNASAPEDYAVVLTDLRMKGMSGTELLAEVKHRYSDIRGHPDDGLRVGGDGRGRDAARRQRLSDQTGEAEELVRVVRQAHSKRSGARSAVYGKRCTR